MEVSEDSPLLTSEPAASDEFEAGSSHDPPPCVTQEAEQVATEEITTFDTRENSEHEGDENEPFEPVHKRRPDPIRFMLLAVVSMLVSLGVLCEGVATATLDYVTQTANDIYNNQGSALVTTLTNTCQVYHGPEECKGPFSCTSTLCEFFDKQMKELHLGHTCITFPSTNVICGYTPGYWELLSSIAGYDDRYTAAIALASLSIFLHFLWILIGLSLLSRLCSWKCHFLPYLSVKRVLFLGVFLLMKTSIWIAFLLAVSATGQLEEDVHDDRPDLIIITTKISHSIFLALLFAETGLGLREFYHQAARVEDSEKYIPPSSAPLPTADIQEDFEFQNTIGVSTPPTDTEEQKEGEKEPHGEET